MEYSIIIPSAKIVSEDLQNIGKLPSVIYPVTEKTVFDFLHEQYVSISKTIKVICYEQADKVKSKLNKYKNTKVLILPCLNDLAYTIYYGLDDTSPVIINFGDTIVFDNIYDNKVDSFFYSEDYISDKWTYFDSDNGEITAIYDKRVEKVNNLQKEKLFVGVFYLSNPVFFKSCIEYAKEINNSSVSIFYLALQLYSKKYQLTPVKTDNWFDIGHADKYFNSKLEVKAREFNHIKIDKNRGILTKTSEDKDKFIGEIKGSSSQ